MKGTAVWILVASFALASFMTVLLGGCARGGGGDGGFGARPARAPLLGKADAATGDGSATGDGGATFVDAADHSCDVVLRRADHLVDARGQGVVATIDVATPFLKYPGQTPGVLFRADGSDWQQVTAQPADGAPAGYTRFVARFLAWQSADFIAFDLTSTDVRLFDHNRLPGDFDSFHVDASNGFSIGDAPSVCPGLPPQATLAFDVGYTQTQHGAIVDGGRIEVDYALERLPTCRDTHDGFRFWSLDAFARFTPGGQVVSGSVVGSNGTTIYPQPFFADVPADATGVQLWFHNWSPTGCDAWDSAYGQNYRFDVVAPAAVPAIGWAGNLGGSTARDCIHHDGLPDPIVIDEYARERACLYVDGDVWVGGVTDGAAPHPEWVQAEVEWSKDDGAATDSWLDDVGRVGNNERFRWQLPYELRNQADWTVAHYALRFSTDGRTWTWAEGGAKRTIERAFTLPGN